jgi:Mn2+/Fe2+ NRAMP family transporter
LAEIAIVATDLAELLGTAIALNLYVFEDASKADEQVIP